MLQLRDDTKTVVVICAIAQYRAPEPGMPNRAQLAELTQIAGAVSGLQALLLSERYRSEGIEVVPPLQCTDKFDLQKKLTEIKDAVRDRDGTNLVLFWSGHGGLDAGSFRLATPETLSPIEQEDGLGLDEIARHVGIARVSTWTLFLDACYAGAGFENIVATVSNQVKAEAGRLRGFGSVFSSAPYERARDSVFLNTVVDVLQNGPSSGAMAHSQQHSGRSGTFNPNDRLLLVSEISKAVQLEYEADPQRFRNAKLPMPWFGDSVPLFPNPQFRKDQPSRLVEEAYRPIARQADLETHFFPKAIGIENLETGWHFTGRVNATHAILDWMKQPVVSEADSVYVLAADGGTGKSALLGRLIALTDKDYRQKATAQGWDEKADRSIGTVPQVDQIDAALNLRNLTAQATTDHLAEILQIGKSNSVEDFVKSARKAYKQTEERPPCIVLDALDEAEDPSSVVRRVIRPLASEGWKVLVATRPSAQARGASDLLSALGSATTYRLDQDSQSPEDIYHYAHRRLLQDQALHAVAEPAAKIIAERAENKFLFAKISTSSLLRSASQVTPATLNQFIAENATAALERDFVDLDNAFCEQFGRSDAGSTALLTALAWAQGDGVPIRDGIWASMANAISSIGGDIPIEAPDIKEEHIVWLLREAGRYIQEAGDGEQAVYRLFHKSLIEHFHSRRTPAHRTERVQEEHIARALVACVRASHDWRYTNPYLVRHMPAHLAARPQQKGLNNLLLNFDWVQARLNLSGINALLKDFDYCESAYPAAARLHRTLSMVSHILREHPEQLIPQMLGRLAPGVPDMRALLDEKPGANFGFAPPSQESLGISERLMLQVPQLDIEQIGPSFIDRTLRLDGFLERARASIKGIALVPELPSTSGGLMQAGALIKVLLGHARCVTSVAVTSDGKTVVSGSNDNTVRVWDAGSGEPVHSLHGHYSEVTSVAVSPDGKTIISGSGDKSVRVWDMRSGALMRVMKGHKHSVTSVAWSRDSKTIVSGSADKTVQVWDAPSGRRLRTLQGHETVVTSVAVSSDGETIVSGGENRATRVWDGQSGDLVRSFQWPENTVTSVAVSPDGKTIASGSRDNTVRVWDAQSGELVRSLHGHNDSVTSVAISADGKMIVSGGDDKAVRVWDAQNGEPVCTMLGRDSAVTSVAVSPDGKTIVSGSSDATVQVWDAQSGKVVLTQHRHGSSVTHIAASPDGKTIVSGSEDQTVLVWDAQSGGLVRTLQAQERSASCVAVSPDGKTIISGGSGKAVLVWDAQSGELLHTLRGHADLVSSIAVNQVVKTIISGSHDDTVRIWDAHSGLHLQTLRGHENAVTSVAVSPDGATIVSGGYDQTVRIWDARIGEIVHILRGHANLVSSVVVSADGKTIVSGSYDRTVRVWDAQSGDLMHLLQGHDDSVRSVAVSPDGEMFASASKDNTVRIWNAQTGLALTRIDLDAAVQSVAFAQSQGVIRIFAASGSAIIRLVQVSAIPPANA